MNETEQLERYLHNSLSPEEKLLIEAQCLVDERLNDKLYWQQKAYALINHFGRKKLKAEIEAVQNRMFSENTFTHFRNRIKKIFNQPL